MSCLAGGELAPGIGVSPCVSASVFVRVRESAVTPSWLRVMIRADGDRGAVLGPDGGDIFLSMDFDFNDVYSHGFCVLLLKSSDRRISPRQSRIK